MKKKETNPYIRKKEAVLDMDCLLEHFEFKDDYFSRRKK